MNHTLTKTRLNKVQGFTIIELMVSVSLFIVVVLIVGSSFLGLVSAYRSTSAIRLNTDNLNASIESMVRGLKTGLTYHCGASAVHATLASVADCGSGGSFIAFESASGNLTNPDDQVVYCLGGSGAPCPATAGEIFRSTDSGTTFLALTAPPPTVNITSLKFFVLGTAPGPADIIQPRVVIVIQGTAGRGRSQTSFSMQTMVTQRSPDTK